MPKLKRVRQGTSAVLRYMIVEIDQRPRIRSACFRALRWPPQCKRPSCPGALWIPAIPEGAGPMGVKSTWRVERSKRAIPNRRLCTTGSAAIKNEICWPGSPIESSRPPKPTFSMTWFVGFGEIDPVHHFEVVRTQNYDFIAELVQIFAVGRKLEIAAAVSARVRASRLRRGCRRS